MPNTAELSSDTMSYCSESVPFVQGEASLVEVMQVCGSDSSTWSSGCCSGKSNFSLFISKNFIQGICQWWDKDSGSGNEDLHKQL